MREVASPESTQKVQHPGTPPHPPSLLPLCHRCEAQPQRLHNGALDSRLHRKTSTLTFVSLTAFLLYALVDKT